MLINVTVEKHKNKVNLLQMYFILILMEPDCGCDGGGVKDSEG